jgi:hypothetical protein
MDGQWPDSRTASNSRLLLLLMDYAPFDVRRGTNLTMN